MSGDFPDDWFRPVEPGTAPPSAEEDSTTGSPDPESANTDPGSAATAGSTTTGNVRSGAGTSGGGTAGGGTAGSGTQGGGTQGGGTQGGAAAANTAGASASGASATTESGTGATGQDSVGQGTDPAGEPISTTGSLSGTGNQSVTTGSGRVPRVDPAVTPARARLSDTDTRGSGPPSGPEPGVIPVIAAPGALVVGRVEGGEADAVTGSRLPPVVVLVMVLVLSLAVGLVIGLLIVGAQPAPISNPSAPATPTPSAPVGSARQPYTGAIARVAPADVEVTASCTASPKPDVQGNLVEYNAANVLDDDSTTAWRCQGDGQGLTLSFTFTPGTKLVGVGVLNGYAKTSGSDRYYDQFRRILAVRWDMPDGTYFIQYLSDNNVSVQRVMIPPTTVDGAVTMTIQDSTVPGLADNAERDAVLISSVEFWTVPG